MSNSCYVPGCRSGYKTDKKRNRENGVKNPTLFKAPNDPCRLAQWAAAIDRTDRPLGPKECVCELHFLESDIDRYFETKLPGGVIHKIPRIVLRLKAHAIPSIFPQFASAEYRIGKKRKACAPIKSKGRERRTSLEREQSPELMISDDEGKYPFPKGQSDADVVSDPFDFQMLVKEAHKIVLPSDMWTVGVLKGNQVIFVNWSDGETVEAKKKVLVDEQLHVKIVFGNVTLSLENIREVHGVEEVVTFLIVIDQLNICEGTENEHKSRSEACIGYTLPRNFTQKGATDPWCHHCRKARKHTVSLKRKKVTADAIEKQSKLCKESMESNRKKNLLPKKGGRLSLDVGPPMCAVDQPVVCCGTGVDSSTVRGAVVKEEVDIEEWTPPPDWDSLPSPSPSQPPPTPTNIGHSVVAVEPLDAERLVVEAHRIPLPSDAWTLGVVRGRRLIFARWADGEVLEAEKRMVIDENLNVKAGV